MFVIVRVLVPLVGGVPVSELRLIDTVAGSNVISATPRPVPVNLRPGGVGAFPALKPSVATLSPWLLGLKATCS